jgi:hypothetical protein
MKERSKQDKERDKEKKHFIPSIPLWKEQKGK